MLEGLYDFLRGSIGLTLLILGISFWMEPLRVAVRRAFGLLFAAVGCLFTLSAVDSFLPLPTDAANFLILALIYALSQALYEIECFVLGGERSERSRFWVYLGGGLWSLLLLLLPFLDYLLGFAPVFNSVEDAAGLGPLHAFTAVAMYLWPVIISFLGIRLSRWSLSDLPAKSPGRLHLIIGSAFVGVILVAVLLALMFSSQTWYRLAHSLLEMTMLAWFFYLVRHPQAFQELRVEVQEGHDKKLLLDAGEVELITKRLASLIADGKALSQPGIDLGSVAAAIQLPAYRLSRYFNVGLGTSFPTWLNTIRIAHACKLMKSFPDRTILDISIAAGYSTKAVFNTQFQRIMGMNPSEYRRSLGTGAS